MNRLIFAAAVIIFAMLLLLQLANIIPLTFDEVISFVFILYGAVAVYRSLSKGDRAILVFSTSVFLAGVILVVKSNYEIHNFCGLVFASVLFISGTAFILLFIENMKEKAFFLSGTVLILLSYFTINILGPIGFLIFVNKACNILENFLPIVLIFMGISVFINRKK